LSHARASNGAKKIFFVEGIIGIRPESGIYQRNAQFILAALGVVRARRKSALDWSARFSTVLYFFWIVANISAYFDGIFRYYDELF
jgi:hypothetical protein